MPTGTVPQWRDSTRQGTEPVAAQGLLAPIARPRPAIGLVPLARLMEESERCLRAAATGADLADSGAPGAPGTHTDTLVARRIIESAESYRRWEREHVRIMGRVAEQNHRVRQSTTALNYSFTLVHNRSLFEYLRDLEVRGARRHDLITHFRGNASYARHVVQEYETWLWAAGSQLCLHHLGQNVLRHPAFGEPLRAYVDSYREYFHCYCAWAVPEPDAVAAADLDAELTQLKSMILERRRELLALPPL